MDQEQFPRFRKMTTGLVSVVIPSFNHEKYIKSAVDSVLTQQYSNLELIVVDDGSKDASLDYLRAVRDSRYKLIEQPNSGAHEAINRGLSLAQGDYLAILNSDDVYHRGRLKECVARLDSGADLVASWIELINSKGKVTGVKKGWKNKLSWPVKPPDYRHIPADDFTVNLLMTNFVSTTSNIVVKRNVYDKTGGMKNLRFVHDWDFLLRAARNFRCELIEKPLLQYRTHRANTISSDRKWMLYEICWIYAVHLRHFTGNMFGLEAAEDTAGEIGFLANSINLQGNDKLLWMLMHYIRERDMHNDAQPEDTLINDENIRNEFIRHIK